MSYTFNGPHNFKPIFYFLNYKQQNDNVYINKPNNFYTLSQVYYTSIKQTRNQQYPSRELTFPKKNTKPCPRKSTQQSKLFDIHEEPSKICSSYIEENPVDFNQICQKQSSKKASFEHDQKFQNIELRSSKLKEKTVQAQNVSDNNAKQAIRGIKFVKFLFKGKQVTLKMPSYQQYPQSNCSEVKQVLKSDEKPVVFDSVSQQTKETNSVYQQLQHKDQKESQRSNTGYLSSIEQQETMLFKRFTTVMSHPEQSKRIQFLSDEETYGLNDKDSNDKEEEQESESEQIDQISQALALEGKYDHYPTPPSSKQPESNQNSSASFSHNTNSNGLQTIMNISEVNVQDNEQPQQVHLQNDNENNEEVINQIDIGNLSTNCTMNPLEESLQVRVEGQPQQIDFQHIHLEQQQQPDQSTMRTMACFSHQQDPFHVIHVQFNHYRQETQPPSPEEYNWIIFNADANLMNYRRIERIEINQRLNIYLIQMTDYLKDRMVGLYSQERQELWTILYAIRIPNYTQVTIQFMINFLTEFDRSDPQKQRFYELQEVCIRQRLQTIELHHTYNDI